MRYHVKIADRSFVVELDGDRATVDGTSIPCELAAISGTQFKHLLVGGRSRAIVARAGQRKGLWEIHVNGIRVDAEVLDERAWAIRSMTKVKPAASGTKPLQSPMPGLILAVEVSAGDVVQAGQGLVIMEAMKMENELKAEAAGTVARVHVAPGQAVDKGALLVEFDPATEFPGDQSERGGGG